VVYGAVGVADEVGRGNHGIGSLRLEVR
jgi:hypothetical protein